MNKKITINTNKEIIINKKEYNKLMNIRELKSDAAFATMRRRIEGYDNEIKSYENEINRLENTIEWQKREMKRIRKNTDPDIRIQKLTQKLVKATERGNKYLIELNKLKKEPIQGSFYFL